LFVDIRIRRSVRAAGFNGPAFEKLEGKYQHRWMKSLAKSRLSVYQTWELQPFRFMNVGETRMVYKMHTSPDFVVTTRVEFAQTWPWCR